MSAPNEKKKYTAEEYYKLIAETTRKVELINGEIVSDYPLDELIKGDVFMTTLAGSTTKHQNIVGGVFCSLYSFIKANKGGCEVFIAPLDVELDDQNVYQPDVFIVCDRDKITEKRIVGAPDLVVEVLSPSSKKHDIVDKYAKYANSGVREYWIVDPSEERTIVYLFGETIHISFYAFDQPIPVGIWDNKLEINISELPGR